MNKKTELELTAFILIVIQLLLFIFGITEKNETNSLIIMVAMCIILLIGFLVKIKLDDL